MDDIQLSIFKDKQKLEPKKKKRAKRKKGGKREVQIIPSRTNIENLVVVEEIIGESKSTSKSYSYGSADKSSRLSSDQP